TDAAVVEGDDVPTLGDGIDDARVPVVQSPGEVDEEDDRDAALRPQLSIGVGDAASGDGARRGTDVGGDYGFTRGVVDAHDGFSLRVSCRPPWGSPRLANPSGLNDECTQECCQARTLLRSRPSADVVLGTDPSCASGRSTLRPATDEGGIRDAVEVLAR